MSELKQATLKKIAKLCETDPKGCGRTKKALATKLSNAVSAIPSRPRSKSPKAAPAKAPKKRKRSSPKKK